MIVFSSGNLKSIRIADTTSEKQGTPIEIAIETQKLNW